MAYAVFPITSYSYPLDHTLEVNAVVHSFGDGYEQRIVTGVPRTRADGVGGVSAYVGVNRFRVGIPHMLMRGSNSVEVLWNFYRDHFYNTSSGIGWRPFYWYNPLENDAVNTWTGDTPSNGVNSRGEAVTNLTGRYLVRFAQPNLTKTLFMRCVTSCQLELVEVAS